MDQLEHLQRLLEERYTVTREIGRGGMATVYRAEDRKHARPVAIKVLKPDLAAVLGADRFVREIRIAAQLHHPHILNLYDSGGEGDVLYYVMPFVQGESLRTKLVRERRLVLPVAVEIAKQVADALGYAHRQGVVHRDVKPENVMLTEGHALVTDFGIAKALSTASDEPLTRTGIAMGTPGYMSPEQAAGHTHVDGRTDVFSLACVVYEMLVGAVPSRWVSEAEVRDGRFMRVLESHEEAVNALSGPVQRALVRGLAIDVESRFATPEDLVHALQESHVPVRRFSDTEADAILRDAANREAVAPTHPGFSIDTVKQIAREVDIPTSQVEAAVAGLDLPPMKPPRILWIPAGVHLVRTVQGVVRSGDHAELLETIQETLLEPGRVEAAVGDMLVWSTDTQHSARKTGRVTRVQITPRGGRTRITISEDRSATFVGVGVGTAVAAVAAPAVATGVGLLLLIPLAVGGAIAIGKLYQIHARKRRALLESLLDRLERRIESTRAPHALRGRLTETGR
ncbi:MAG TPA: serine/threonine-protein kinase [Gemmatimonadales bacterium]|jgi:serine/threonine protein kinase